MQYRSMKALVVAADGAGAAGEAGGAAGGRTVAIAAATPSVPAVSATDSILADMDLCICLRGFAAVSVSPRVAAMPSTGSPTNVSTATGRDSLFRFPSEIAKT